MRPEHQDRETGRQTERNGIRAKKCIAHVQRLDSLSVHTQCDIMCEQLPKSMSTCCTDIMFDATPAVANFENAPRLQSVEKGWS